MVLIVRSTFLTLRTVLVLQGLVANPVLIECMGADRALGQSRHVPVAAIHTFYVPCLMYDALDVITVLASKCMPLCAWVFNLAAKTHS
jgi:hypothetical protein